MSIPESPVPTVNRKLFRALLFLLIIIFSLFVMILTFLDLMKLYDKSIHDVAFIAGISFTLIIMLMLFFKFMLNYLDVRNENHVISSQSIPNLALEYDATFDNETRENLVQEVKEKIQKEAIDVYLNEIREGLKLKDSIEYSKFQSSQTLTRIKTAISAQNAKANFNLALGVIATIIGVIFLIFFIPNYNSEYINLSQFLIAFLPRLSVVILIETLAYFFLRMYKYNLNEIKYFQNEATSIEHRLQSLNIAIQSNDKETLRTVLLSFSQIDKNKDHRELISEHMPLSVDYLVKIAEILKGKNG